MMVSRAQSASFRIPPSTVTNHPPSVCRSVSVTSAKKHVAFADEVGCKLVTMVHMLQPEPFSESRDSVNELPPPIRKQLTPAVFQALASLSKCRGQFGLRKNFSGSSSSGATTAPAPCAVAHKPPLPNSAVSAGALGATPTAASNESAIKPCCANMKLRFPEPLLDYNHFTQRLERVSVALENASINAQGTRVSGFIKVRNIVLEKYVFVRFTDDDWETFKDVRASYILGVPGEPFDTFKFEFDLQCNGTDSEHEVEFCVGFRSGAVNSSQEFWDSNEGKNYRISSAVGVRKRKSGVSVSSPTSDSAEVSANSL